ncbi:unnamed protein product [Rotaria sordida]|uniref:t-SNARE coiled-coil homology domain-containing protein n=1 Tax=Rotaria sordida TaxID=392033 RepID=A0A815XQ23_9BILA|nr:unnamed protein product [Rotaria sordida]
MIDAEKHRQIIEERHRDIQKLENSVNELHNMFADLAWLVTTEGEMIDNIDHSLSKAADDVERATNDIVYVAKGVQKVVDTQTKTRKIKMILCIILIVIIVILILIFVIYYITRNNILGR